MKDLNLSDTAVVIPALDPDVRFAEYIRDLLNVGFSHIIVVDDGSTEDSAAVFRALKEMGVILLRHGINCGKGRALKTAFNEILVNHPEIQKIVTADNDGTYMAKDVLEVALHVEEDTITLGSRNFADEYISSKNRTENKATILLLKLLAGIAMSDSQTGLRAYPRSLLPYLIRTSGERYEYEFNMIFEKKKIALKEVPIATTPRMSGKRTHFRAVKDSWTIIWSFILFILVSLSSTILDLLIYQFGITIFEEKMPILYIAVSTFIARVVSDTYNYYLDKTLVFKADETAHFGRYVLLALAKTAASALLVSILVFIIGSGEMPIKLVIDMLIFFVGYRFEKTWVYEK